MEASDSDDMGMDARITEETDIIDEFYRSEWWHWIPDDEYLNAMSPWNAPPSELTANMGCMERRSHIDLPLSAPDVIETHAGDEVQESELTAASPSAPLKRRRISVKSPEVLVSRGSKPDAPFVECVPSSGVLEGEHTADPSWWHGKAARQKYDYVYNNIKRSTYKAYQVAHPERESWPSSWTSLPVSDKEALIRLYASTSVDYVRAYSLNELMPKTLKSVRGRPRAEVQILLTYQGSWGVLDLSSQPVQAGCTPADLVPVLTSSPSVLKLWQAAKLDLKRMCDDAKAQYFAMSLELCTRTWEEEQSIRVHFHVCLRNSTTPLMLGEGVSFRLLGTDGFMQRGVLGKNYTRAKDWAPFYYCACLKIGVLMQLMNRKANVDYLVSEQWIWNLLQGGKITTAAAKVEFTNCTKNVIRNLQNLEAYARERIAAKLRQKLEATETILQMGRAPFRKLTAVEDWLRTFDSVKERRRFLVLDGPSCLGKTQFVTSLVPYGCALQLNCAGLEAPPLRIFDHEQHRLILFDEAQPHMIAKHRRLFQCPNIPVVLGSSPTNTMTYEVYVNDTRLVICSNSWSCELRRMPAEDAAWVAANQVLVTVETPLWDSSLMSSQPSRSSQS